MAAIRLWYPRSVVVHPGPLSAVPAGVWCMPGERTSVYLSTDLAAAVKASGQPPVRMAGSGASGSISPARDCDMTVSVRKKAGLSC